MVSHAFEISGSQERTLFMSLPPWLSRKLLETGGAQVPFNRGRIPRKRSLYGAQMFWTVSAIPTLWWQSAGNECLFDQQIFNLCNLGKTSWPLDHCWPIDLWFVGVFWGDLRAFLLPQAPRSPVLWMAFDTSDVSRSWQLSDLWAGGCCHGGWDRKGSIVTTWLMAQRLRSHITQDRYEGKVDAVPSEHLPIC